MTMRGVLRALLAAAITIASPAGAQEFTFDAAEFEKKPFELGGYLELKYEHLRLNQNGAYYNLNFLNQPRRDALDAATATFKPSGKFRAGTATLNFRAHVEVEHNNFGENQVNRFDEFYASFKPDARLTVDAGKYAFKWGKGYAWNPVGFVERQKDPNDPELGREGFTALSADFVRNFDGALKTVAFTPLVLPVSSDVNSDFGRNGHTNVAAKLYLLYHDTDIDFMFLNNGSRSGRYGFDFSRNVTSSLELHGEWARITDVDRRVVDSAGTVRATRGDVSSYLFGARYLTESDTTYIVEYYRNGAGYTEEQATDFFRFVDSGAGILQTTGSMALLSRAAALAQSGYGRPYAGRNYLYARASQKEPFDMLYFTPSLTLITNLDDGSSSLSAEALYTGFKNVELRLRAFLLSGAGYSEFGEKQNRNRVELLARFYF